MDELLIKYLLGEATPEEEADVARWLGADEANRERLERLRAVWGLGRRMAEDEAAVFDHREPWRAIREKLMRAPVRRMPVRWIAAAVIGVLLLGAGGVALLRHGKRMQQLPLVLQVQKEGAGAKGAVPERKWIATRPRTDTLPDGSVVTLNRGGRLAIVGNEKNGGLRMRLNGEGFFSVRHNPARAVVVEIEDVTVSIIGTSFELNGRDRDSIALVVETGAVRVSGRHGDSLVVRAGQRATVTKDGRCHRERGGDDLYGYYLGRPLVCDSVPLRRVVEVLNQAYDAHVELGRKGLGDLPLTAVFGHDPLDKILRVIGATFDLSSVRRGQKIVLQ